jgi:WhiB family redox-sensing transcriptional regulator
MSAHLADAACADHPADLWFPDLEDDDNHGAQARTICATCPAIRPCLERALADNEAYGIWGGAGGMRLRALRRAFKAGGQTWEAAFELHLGRLDGNVVDLIDANGAAATHGLEATYAKGCRCEPCALAVSQSRAARRAPLVVVGERCDATEIANRQSAGVPVFLQPKRTA